jgi:hypothetical protein
MQQAIADTQARLDNIEAARGNVAPLRPAVEEVEETPCDKIDPATVKRDVADVLQRRGIQNAPDIARRAVEMQQRYGWQIDGVPIRRPVRATVRFIMADMGRFTKPTHHEAASMSFFNTPEQEPCAQRVTPEQASEFLATWRKSIDPASFFNHQRPTAEAAATVQYTTE